MFLLKVVPVEYSFNEGFLSYFSSEEINIGSLIEINLKNKKTLGIVFALEKATEKKISIKSQKFSLKKINKILIKDFLDSRIVESLAGASALFGIKIYDIFKNYLPQFIFDNLNSLKRLTEVKAESKIKIKNGKNIYILEELNLRLKREVKIIEESFKKNESLVIFYPTITELEFAEKYFKKYLKKEKIFSFHSNKKENELAGNLDNLSCNSCLILSTPSLLPFLLKIKLNINTIILEKENSVNYYGHESKKYINSKNLIKKLTKDLNLALIVCGNIFSLETFQDFEDLKIKKDTYKIEKALEVINISKNKIEKEEIESRIKKLKNKKENKYNKVYFSEELIQKLENIKKNNGKAFLYAKRKGLYTETICSDCNTILKCENCDKPYTLFKTSPFAKAAADKQNVERVYICTSCKNKIELKKSENLTCSNCGGWKMNTLGVGVEGVEENLKEIGFKTFLLDSDHAKTRKQVNKIINSWQNEKEASILIGTDLALNFLNKDYICDLGAIISLDSLFSIPEITIDEKIFNICLEMRERISGKDKIQNKIIIQTRLPEQEVFKYIENLDVIGFLKNELETRKMLNLPPFSNILKWRLEKKEIKIKEEIDKILNRIFKEENIKEIIPNYKIDKKSGAYIGTLIIKKEVWDKNGKLIPSSFAKKITTLLSDFKLEINPVNIN